MFGLEEKKIKSYFEIIFLQKKLITNFKNMIYIGDNPNKDFVNCNEAGMMTVRLLTGEFKNIKKNIPMMPR